MKPGDVGCHEINALASLDYRDHGLRHREPLSDYSCVMYFPVFKGMGSQSLVSGHLAGDWSDPRIRTGATSVFTTDKR